MSSSLHRRRFVTVTAAAAGFALPLSNRRALADTETVTWRGHAMGAAASVQIQHPDRAKAERILRQGLSEVRRLEQVFSLYRHDSDLAGLNRYGILIAPPSDLVALLGECRRLWELTGGTFDPTVQPLWSLYRAHFSEPAHDPDGPSPDALRAALDKVGFQHVSFDRNRIILGRPGMGLTLNGIAQGYATDRLVDVFLAEGLTHSLVDIGESRATGGRADGTPWRIGVADPDMPDRVAEVLDITEGAVATSGGYGFEFDSGARFNHLLDPVTGGSAHRYRSVTVRASKATAADGLSTAFSLLSEEKISDILAAFKEGQAFLLRTNRERRVLTARTD